MNEDNFDNLEYDDENWVSRSQKKRDVEALQDIGVRLVELKPDQLEKIDISDTLREAIIEAKRLTSRSAIRRHMQYIGKLMRTEDGEEIQAAIDRFDVTTQAHNQVFHKLEKWRDRLINNEKGMLDVILTEYPQTDMQHLRQLVRNAQKEQSQNKPPAATRKLFKYLRELEENR
jgi:ribosome-associated protein